jgi:hypothetical protein
VLDDQPVWIQTATKPVVSVPYSLEINDIAMMVIQNHPAEKAAAEASTSSDRLVRGERDLDARDGDRHPPLYHGVPHRIRYLEELYRYILAKPGVVHWTGAEIANWFRTQKA